MDALVRPKLKDGRGRPSSKSRRGSRPRGKASGMNGVCESAARDLSADEIAVGLTAQFDRDVTEQDILAFADNSGDHNPLHVDACYAAGTNHGGRIAHGAFQVGLASAMIGMYLPGRRVLLSSLQARFPAPLKFPSRVRVCGKIVAWNRETRSGRLNVTVTVTSRELVTADMGWGFTRDRNRDASRPAGH